MWDIVAFRLLVYFLSFLLFFKGVKYLRFFTQRAIQIAAGTYQPKVKKQPKEQVEKQGKAEKTNLNDIDAALKNDVVSAMVNLGMQKKAAAIAAEYYISQGETDFNTLVRVVLQSLT